MSRLYLTAARDEIARRRGLAPKGQVVEAWPDHAEPGALWIGDETRALLDSLGEPIKVELARDGQVYVLHNRVETITEAARKLQELIPEARIGIIHGRMDEKKLLRELTRFREKVTNVLVATTIIENGKKMLEAEKTKMVEDAKKDIVNLAMLATEKLLSTKQDLNNL